MEITTWNLRYRALVDKKTTRRQLLGLQSGCPQAKDPHGVDSPSRRLPFTQRQPLAFQDGGSLLNRPRMQSCQCLLVH